MALYLFAIILCLFNSIYSLQNKSNIRQYILKYESEDYDFSNKFSIKDNINYLNEIKNDNKSKIIEMLKNFLKLDLNEKAIYNVIILYLDNITEFCKSYFSDNNMTIIGNIIEDILNQDKGFINEIVSIIANKSNNVMANFIKLLENKFNSNNFTNSLKNILKVPQVFELYKHLYSNYNESLIPIIEVIIRRINDKNLSLIFNNLKDFIDQKKDDLYILIYNAIMYFDEREKIIELFRDFVLSKTQNNKFFEDLKVIIDNTAKVNETLDALFEYINKTKSVGAHLIKELLLNREIMDFVFKQVYDELFVSVLGDIFMNIYNKTKVKPLIKEFFDHFKAKNIENLGIFLDAAKIIAMNLVKQHNINEFFRNTARDTIKYYIFTNLKNYTKISGKCIDLFTHSFLNGTIKDNKNENLDSNAFFIKKLIFESSLNKNDFLNYENCLSSKNVFFNVSQNISNVRPIYIIGMVEDFYNKTKYRDSIFFEKYNYLQTLCLPQGVNTSTNEDICSEEDYDNFVNLFSQISYNLSNSSIETLIFNGERINISGKDSLLSILIFILLNLPLFIKFFLFIFLLLYKRLKKNTNSEIINKLTLDEDKKSDNNQEKEKIIKNEKNNIQLENPKCYQILNKYFDLINNLKELFNFSSPKSDYDNINGISYIKGILGISLFLNIIGQTFFILMNILHKTTSIYEFYGTINNFFYIFIFVGLRYAPRLIFSCSGYTLAYKFLSFIENDSDLYFLKFLFFQSYKYILLILISIIMKYSLYYINIIFHSKTNPLFELLNFTLGKYNKNYFYNLLSLLFFNLSRHEFENTKSIIQFLYLPINEVFLFIFGIALISLGYKFKIRIDIIIIGIILAILLIKILFFSFYASGNKLYPTLYFYSFGFGSLMLNPLYNLPCFLIGMFFGLVNFTIHRGANINGYSKVELLDSTNKTNIEEINKKKDSWEDFHGSSFDDNYKNISNDKIDVDFKRNLTSENKELNNKTNELLDNDKINDEDTTSLNLDDNFNEQSGIIQKMPFLKLPIILRNFHKRNQSNIKIVIIIAVPFLILLILFISLRYIIIGTYIKESIKEDNKKFIEKFSLEDIITNKFLNIIYLIDLEFFVLIINWIFFYFYYKGGQLNDFFSHNYWNFFIKSYFSYALVSGPVILYIFYADETVIKVSIPNVILYSLINIIFVFFFTIIFYTYYEYPFRKLIKDLKGRKKTNEVVEEEDDECNRENDDFSILA